MIQLRRLLIFPANGFVHLLTVYSHIKRRFYTKADLITPDVYDGDLYIIADHYGFVSLTREHKHSIAPESQGALQAPLRQPSAIPSDPSETG